MPGTDRFWPKRRLKPRVAKRPAGLKPGGRAVSRGKGGWLSNRGGGRGSPVKPEARQAPRRAARGPRGPEVKIACAACAAAVAGRGADQFDDAARDGGRRVNEVDRPGRQPFEASEQQRESACRRARSCPYARPPDSIKQGASSARDGAVLCRLALQLVLREGGKPCRADECYFAAVGKVADQRVRVFTI